MPRPLREATAIDRHTDNHQHSDLAPFGALGRHLSNLPDAHRTAHIVDTLIEERAGRLLERPLLWWLIRHLVYPLLGYRQALAVAAHIAPLDGHAAMRYLAAQLQLRIDVRDGERIPARGAAIVVANHPTGIADGIALYALLGTRRADLAMFVNRDALRICPGLADIMIPVPWRAGDRNRATSRATLRAAVRAFENDRLVVLFPSGRLAHRTANGLRERPWLPTAVSFAQRFSVPIVPVHIGARNSRLFYLVSRFSTELRDMTLFHEVLNKRRCHYRIRVGEALGPAALHGDVHAVTARLQQFVEFELGRPGGAAAPDWSRLDQVGKGPGPWAVVSPSGR